MSKADHLREIADRIERNYTNPQAVAEGFRLIADHIEASEPATLHPDDNPKAGTDATSNAGA